MKGDSILPNGQLVSRKHAALQISPSKLLITIFFKDLRINDRYRLERRLGGGSFGDVYLGK